MKSLLNRHFRNRKTLFLRQGRSQLGRTFETLETRFALANSAPVVPDVTPFVAVEDTPTAGQLSAMDPDGDAFLFSIKSQPINGTVVMTNVATGEFLYTPNPNFSGISDTFIYVVTDEHGVVSNNGIVELDVTPVNDAPIASSKTFWVAIGSGGVQGALPVVDVDGDPLTYQIVNDTDKGFITIGANGNFIYVPNANSPSGQDSFEFTATDFGGSVSNVGKIRFQYVVANNSIDAIVDEFNPSVLTITGPAGSVIVSPDGGYNLIVRGDGTFVNNSLQPISYPGIKTLFINIVDPAGISTEPSKVWIQSRVRLDYLEINTGLGADVITLGADPKIQANNDVQDPNYGAGGYLLLKTYIVNTGDGADTIYERYTRISEERFVDLGRGQDTFDLYGSTSTPESHSFIDTKTLEDSVKLGYGTFFGSIDVQTGDLADLISVYACYFGGTAIFNAGQGDDSMAFDVNRWTAAATINGGADNNFMLFSRSIALNAQITLTSNSGFDSGDDEYVVGKYILGSNGNGFIYGNGGSRISSLNLNSGFGNDKVTVSSNVIDNFYAELLEGNDELILDGGIYSFVPNLHGGNGTNRLRNPNGIAVNATNFQLS